MTTQKAKAMLAKLVPAYYTDGGDGEVVGMAMSVLLSEGYHDFTFTGLDGGGLKLETGNIEVVDEREEPSRGETQRHIQLLVRAAVLAHGGAPTFPDNTPDQTMSVSVPEASKGSPDETL